jgi:hypothetical protein
MRIWAKWWTVVILLIFWPGALLSQRAIYFAQNVNPPASAGTITYTGNGCANNSGSSSITCTTTSSVTAGQTIFINLSEYTGGITPTLTDSVSGQTITSVLGGSTGTTYDGEYDWVWIIPNAGEGVHALTITSSSAMSYPAIIANVLSRGTVDGTPSGVGINVGPSPSQTASCGSVTTTAANEFILTFMNVNGGGTLTLGAAPQAMTAAYEASPNDASAYSTAAIAGANYVQWSSSSYLSSICDTVAVH